jgi:hypothetical protein
MEPIETKQEARVKGKLSVCLMVGLLMVVATGEASSPGEWEKHQKEVVATCTKASGLKGARVIGDIVSFGDDIGLDAVMVRGRYPQPHMENAEGHALCLFNRQTRQAQCNEANQWFDPGKK